MGGLHPSIAKLMGRPDHVRSGGVEGRGGTTATGAGRIYGSAAGAGATAAGLSSEARLGGAMAKFTADTGTISMLFMAGIVVGVFAWYFWTRGSQS